MKKSFLLLITSVFSLANLAFAQNQTIRGEVFDLDSQYPLTGVNVIIIGSDPILGSTTDLNGRYAITGVPVGRVSVKFSYIGYKEVVLVDQLLEKGKELFINIKMQEEITAMNEVIITNKRDPLELNNDAAIVATRAFDIEETRRYAGTRNDIARMASNYAGVINADDARNDIIIRGNSPSGMLWRLEGIDIPNPNHYNAFGTSGGPVSMLNNNNMANSDFFMSAFPADYGNTISGVFDLKLRKGNGFKSEYMGQIGFNGLELGAEGPLSKKTNASYMANYRYSTLGLFSALGVNFGTGTAVPQYQDLTFAVDLPSVKTGSFKIFGLGGISDIHFESTTENDENGSLYTTADLKNQARVGVIGVRHEYFFNSKLNISTSVAASQQHTAVIIDSVYNNPVSQQIDDIRTNQTVNKFSLHTALNNKISNQHKVNVGVMLDYLDGSFQDSLYRSDGTWFKFGDTNSSTFFYQIYSQYQWRINDQLKLVGGLHYSNLTLNNSQSLDPRIAISYNFLNGTILSAGYGLHSQMQPLNVYSYKFEEAPGASNTDLGFTRSHHFTLDYNYRIRPSLQVKLSTYYQYIFDAPVETQSSPYSMLNFGTTYGNEFKPYLLNNGIGKNYGVELTLEKYFSDSYYFLITGSLFDSQYQGSDEIWRNTGFNSGYALNVLAGKEFKLGKNGVLTADLKLTTSGGRFTTPIDLVASRNAGETVYFDSEAFSRQYDDYFRMDFKIGYRVDMKRISQEWIIDIQNVFNTENIYEEFFNLQTGNIDNRNQLGMLIIPQYRILF
jgi:hypothetical protein